MDFSAKAQAACWLIGMAIVPIGLLVVLIDVF